ncbi:MAG: GFA family protein [Pseudomonadales bacterium]|nr:GFA family protein [Pseudomonadales bacterium]
MKSLNAQTRCLCGAVKITVDKINPEFTVCHCESCRVWSGAPYFAVQCGSAVKIEGQQKVTEYQSSSWASRGFCSDCGTHLFFKMHKSGEYNMPVGLFQHLEGLKMDMQYFSDQRPDYYCFSNETKEMTKAEIMDYFAADI